uniref:Uncharacterized protein n=1 Tax=Oryza brachyantha TaxID=4533 RepID=J3MRN1_ORYBR
MASSNWMCYKFAFSRLCWPSASSLAIHRQERRPSLSTEMDLQGVAELSYCSQ